MSADASGGPWYDEMPTSCTCRIVSGIVSGRKHLDPKDCPIHGNAVGILAEKSFQCAASGGARLKEQPSPDDWKRFCVNHNGFSGPTSRCPTCSPASMGGSMGIPDSAPHSEDVLVAARLREAFRAVSDGLARDVLDEVTHLRAGLERMSAEASWQFRRAEQAESALASAREERDRLFDEIVAALQHDIDHDTIAATSGGKAIAVVLNLKAKALAATGTGEREQGNG